MKFYQDPWFIFYVLGIGGPIIVLLVLALGAFDQGAKADKFYEHEWLTEDEKEELRRKWEKDSE